MHSLLADESGIIVQTADMADAIAPANNMINNSHLIDVFTIFEMPIFNRYCSFYFKKFARKF
jgi:hypothetical protein